jgi:hypothetical protein
MPTGVDLGMTLVDGVGNESAVPERNTGKSRNGAFSL